MPLIRPPAHLEESRPGDRTLTSGAALGLLVVPLSRRGFVPS